MPSSRFRRALPALLTAAVVMSTAGCQFSNFQFKQDHRLTFETPKSRAKVKVPLTISWSMKDFDPTGLDGSKSKGTGVYAMFLDTSPMPVGHDLKWLFRNDTTCKRDPRCPSASYLSDRGIYVTTKTTVTIQQLPTVADGVGDEQHGVTVVLLDGTGTRRTESNWYRAFTSKRRSTE